MRILHLRKSGGFYGVERMLVELGPHAGAKATHVLGVLLDDPGASRDFADRAAARGIPVLELRADGKFSLGVVRVVQGALLREPFDLVHCHGYKADLVGFAAVRAAGPALRRAGRSLPLVTTIHGWHGDVQGNARVRLNEWLDQQAMRRFDFVIANSSATFAQAERLGFARERLRVVHYGIEPIPWDAARVAAERRRVRDEIGLSDATRLVLCLGRLSPEKGHPFAIEAMASLVHERGLDVRLAILGHGPEKERLEACVKRHRLESHVLLPGFTREVDAWLAASDLFLLPSLQEEFGQVTLEAYRLARPVVATRTWGIPDVVEDGRTGLLVPPADAGAIGEAVGALLGDPARARALGEAGHARFLAHFTAERMVADHEALYAELVARARGARGTGGPAAV